MGEGRLLPAPPPPTNAAAIAAALGTHDIDQLAVLMRAVIFVARLRVVQAGGSSPAASLRQHPRGGLSPNASAQILPTASPQRHKAGGALFASSCGAGLSLGAATAGSTTTLPPAPFSHGAPPAVSAAPNPWFPLDSAMSLSVAQSCGTTLTSSLLTTLALRFPRHIEVRWHATPSTTTELPSSSSCLSSRMRPLLVPGGLGFAGGMNSAATAKLASAIALAIPLFRILVDTVPDVETLVGQAADPPPQHGFSMGVVAAPSQQQPKAPNAVEHGTARAVTPARRTRSTDSCGSGGDIDNAEAKRRRLEDEAVPRATAAATMTAPAAPSARNTPRCTSLAASPAPRMVATLSKGGFPAPRVLFPTGSSSSFGQLLPTLQVNGSGHACGASSAVNEGQHSTSRLCSEARGGSLDLPTALLDALPLEKQAAVANALAYRRDAAATGLSDRLDAMVDLERLLSLYDLAKALFGTRGRVVFGAQRLVELLCAQCRHGDREPVVRRQLLRLVSFVESGMVLKLLGDTSAVGVGAAAHSAEHAAGLSELAAQAASAENLERFVVELDRARCNRRGLEDAVAKVQAESKPS